MKLEDILMSLAQYAVGFKVSNGKFIVNITYDKSWTIIQPVDDSIKVMKDSEQDVYYYVAPVSIGMDQLFSVINDTIDYNRELEKKLELFKKKIEELREPFAQETLSALQNLKFVVEQKKKPGRKPKKQSKTEQAEEDDKVIDGVDKTEIVEEQQPPVEKENEVKENIQEIEQKEQQPLSDIDSKIYDIIDSEESNK